MNDHPMRYLRKILAVFLSADLALLPAIASAQQAAPSIVIDNHSMPGAPAPNLDRTSNGVQQLNIATPNGAGLSHNMFTEYGVEQKGLILNNATKATQTQLGGYVYGNANLNGTGAKVILNEVTGPHASQMLGATEVAGQSANVVVANPNGITCNGCGFINTSRVTLATGHSEIDTTGKLSALRVQDGYVAFEGQGGNFTAVPVLDILSRRVTFNAPVNAQNARLVVGQNRVDYETGQVQALNRDGSAAPAFAIDSSALGGLYAGQISMLVNEAGAGVRVNGTMAANAGDMTLTADGQLVLNGTLSATGRIEIVGQDTQQAGSIQSGASTQLTSSGTLTQSGQIQAGQEVALSAGSVHNTGSLKSAGNGGIHIAARNDARNSGTIAASNGGLAASGQSLVNEAGGVFAAEGPVTLQSAGDMANNGQIASQNGLITLRAGGRLTQSGGEVAAQGGALSIGANTIGNDATVRITARDAMRITATQLDNAGTIIAGQDLSFDNGPALVNSGTIQASSLSGAALQSLTNTGTIQAESGALSLLVQSTLRNSGTLYAASGASIGTSGALDNSDGQIGAGTGALSINAGSIANNRGNIIASSGALLLTAAGNIDNSAGTVSSTGAALSLAGQALTNTGGGVIYAFGPLKAELTQYSATQGASLASDATLELMASGAVQNDGQILSVQGMTLGAQGGMVNDTHGQIVATTGGLSVTAQGTGLTNNGQLGTLTNGAVTLAGQSYAGSGLVQSVDSLSLNLDRSASVDGSLLAGKGDLSLTAGTLSSTGQIGAQTGSLIVSVQDRIRNSGTLYGATGTTIRAGGALDNSDGQIGAESGAVSVVAGSVANNRGRVIATSDALGLTASGDIDNTDGTISAKNGPLSLTGQALTNSGAGVIYASGPLNAELAQYQSAQDASLASDSGLSLKASGSIQNQGLVQSSDAMTLEAGTGLDNGSHGRIIASNGDLDLVAHGAGLNNDGQIGTLNAGVVHVRSSALTGAGLIQSADGLDIDAVGSVAMTGSLLAGRGDLTLSFDDFSSSGEIGAQDGVLTLSSRNTLRNSGTLYGASGTILRVGGMLDNSGGQIGNGTGSLTITSAALLNVQGKIIAPNGGVSLISGDVDNRAGTIQGQERVAATISALDNRDGGTVLSLGSDLDIANGSSALVNVLNQGGTIGATGSLTLAAQRYESDSGSSLLGNDGVALTVSGALDNLGLISSGTALTLTVARLNNAARGLIAAKDGDLTLRTTAQTADALSNSGIIQSSAAGKTLRIVTAGLFNAGSVLGNGDVSVSASDTLVNSGKLSALGGSLGLAASSLQNSGTMAASSLLSLQFATSADNSGTLYGTQGVTLTADGLENHDAGQIGADTGTVSITTGTFTNTGGTILSTRRDLSIQTDSLINEGGILQGQTGQSIETARLINRAGGQILTRDGVLDIAGRQGVPSTAIVNDASTLQASSSLSIKANSLTNGNGTILTTAGAMDIALSRDGALDNTGGIIQSAGNLSLGAGAYTGSIASMLTSSGDMGLLLSGDVVNAGHIDAGGNLTLTAQSITNLTGQSADSPAVISAKGQTLALTAQTVTNAGAIQASGDLGTLQLEASSLQNSGTIAAQRDIGTSITGSLGNTGTFVSRQGALTLNAQDVANSGFLGSAAKTQLIVGDSATNTGVVYADAGVVARMAGQFDNTGGQIGTANGDIALDAAQFSNESGRIIAQGGALTLTGAVIDNRSGVLQADGSVALVAAQLDNTLGLALSKSAGVSVGTDNAPGLVTNTQGIIQGNGPISIGFADLANDNGQILAQAGALTLHGMGTGSVTNTNGAIQATGALTLTTGSYQGGEGSQVTSGQAMGLTVSNGFSSAGKIASVGDMVLRAGSLSNNQSGIIASTQGNLALTSEGALTNQGLIQTESSGGLLSIHAGSLENAAQAGIVANGNAALTLQGGLDNAGEVTAHGDQMTLNALHLSNSNLMLSGGSLSLALPGDLTNSGLIYGLADVTVTTANADNHAGQIGSGQGLLSLTASALRNDQGGRIIGTDGSVRISAGTVANDNGLVQAGHDITLQTGRLSNDAGQVLAVGGSLSVARDAAGHALDDLLNNGGRLQAGLDLSVAAQQVESAQGTILTQEGDLVLTAGQGARMRQFDLTGGTLQAGRDLTLYTSAIAGASTVQATRNLAFSTAQDVGGFLFSAGGDARLALDSGWHIAAGAGVIAGGGLTATAPEIENNGALIAGGMLSLSTPGSVTNTGLISGTQGVQIALDGNLLNRQGAILSDAGDLTIGGRSGQLAGDVTNSSGQILTGSAQGDVVISARSLTNDIIGGVTYQQGQVVYSQTYDQALANPPTPSNIGNTGQYYWGQKILAVQTPAGLLTADGKPGSGYVLVALYGGKDASKVVVTGVGSLATASNAPSVISAGHDLVVTTSGAITNDASHLAAGNDMTLKGGSLNNVGYDTSVTYTLTCYNGNSCRWYMPPEDAANPWFPGGWQIGSGGGWPWPSQIWGSSRSNGLSGTIVAANSLIGDFAGEINNSTIIQHATSEQLAAASHYQGNMPGDVTAPGMNGQAVGGGALTLPGTDRPTGNIDLGMSGGVGAQSGVSGSGLTGGFVTGAGQQAAAQAGHEGLGAFDAGAFAQGGNGMPNGGTLTPGGLQPGQEGGGLSGHRPASGGSGPSLAGGGVLPQEGVQTAADAAQNLRLPGFLNSADPSVMQVITSIPAGTALYVPNPSPQAHYLVETNPAYTSLTAFHGSQYLVDRLGKSPSDYTFLGDSYFDQQYVQQQIVSATGQTFLGGTFVNASSQMQQLVTNAGDQAQRLGLTFGQALSDEQKASLTQNIVWYVPVQVNGATVLAPKLYLAPGNVALSGGTIAAKDVSLAGSSVTNSGTISGSNSLSILARNGDITNTGTLAGGSVSLVAQNGSIINSATLNDYLVNGGNQGQLGSVGTITASGAASLSASNDITFNGGRLSSGGDLSMLAGNSLTLGAATVRQATAVKGANVSSAFSQTQNYTSSISAGGNAVLAALGGDLKSAGATIDSTGNMVLSAAKSLDLGSVTDSTSHDISGSKSGFLTHSRFTDTGSLSIERGSNVTSGGTLTGLSGGDMSLKGLIGAQGDVTLSAGGTLTLEATKTQSEASASHHVAGISLSSQGAQGTLGYGMRDDRSSSSSTVWTPSVLASLGGSVALNAGKALTIDGSALSAANDLTLSGSSVSLLAKENSQTQSMAHKEKSIGASIGLSPTSIVGQVVNTGLAASQTSGSGSGTLAALNAMQGAAIIATSIIKGGDAVAGNIVGVRQSIGSSSLHQSSTQTQTQAVGTTLNAGNTLSVVARGDNVADAQNGSLSATASSLSGKDVVLAASKDITLQAGWDTTHSESDMKSKSTSVGLDIGVGVGGYSASLSASFGKQTQHVVSDSATAVNTTVNGAQSVTIASPGSVTLNGATVTAPRLDLAAGSLNITSPQNTSDYRSTASQSGGQLSLGYKTGIGGSGLNQTVTDHFATTGSTLSGLYAGENGIGVDVAGQTSLTAGVIDSKADAAKNHFNTGSLVANSVTNVSQWKATQTGMSMSLGTDMLGSTMGILGAVGTNLASGASGMMGGGRTHDETSESQSAISGNVTVNAGSITGHYITDVSKANAALENAFDAKKLSNQLQAQRLGSQLAGEIGGLVADQLEKAGVAGFGEKGIANSYGRIALETAANTAVAAVSGGNIGAAAAGTAAGGLATSAALAGVSRWALAHSNGNIDDAVMLASAMENLIGSGAGALGGMIGGAGTGSTGINALNGASQASSIEQYNLGGHIGEAVASELEFAVEAGREAVVKAAPIVAKGAIAVAGPVVAAVATPEVLAGAAIAVTVYGGYKYYVYLRSPAEVSGNTTVNAEQKGDTSKTSTPEAQPELQKLPNPDEDPNGNLKKAAAAAAVAAALGAKNVTKEIASSFDAKEFEASLSGLASNERVGLVRTQAAKIAQSNGWKKNTNISKINNRDVYQTPKGELYSVDTRHGRFEKIDPNRGRHLGEFDFNLNPKGKMDKTGGHDLKVR